MIDFVLSLVGMALSFFIGYRLSKQTIKEMGACPECGCHSVVYDCGAFMCADCNYWRKDLA